MPVVQSLKQLRQVPVPRVSVIITTHSRPDLLPRAVQSAREAGASVEVVVVDDGSTDRTAAVCRELPGIRYVRADLNQGVAGARNIGILASSSELLAFLDDDDLRLPGSLDLQSAALESRPEAGMVYGRTYIGDADCECRRLPSLAHPPVCPQGDIFWELLSHSFIYVQSVVFRRACLHRVGLMDPSLAGVDDRDLWLRIAERYPVAAVEEPVAIWRRATPVSGQGSSFMCDLVMRARRAHERKWMRLPRVLGAAPAQRRLANARYLDSLSDLLLWNGMSGLALGHAAYARRNALLALRLRPRRAARLHTFRLLLGIAEHRQANDAGRRLPIPPLGLPLPEED